MKSILIASQTLLVLSVATLLFEINDSSEKVPTGQLTVELDDIEKEKGQIVFLLFEDSDGFPNDVNKALKKGIVAKFGKTATYTFNDLPFGTYSIAVFQDLDKNLEIATNFIGMPKEPVGASNMTSMGRPNFKKCSFEFKETSKTIRLQFILK